MNASVEQRLVYCSFCGRNQFECGHIITSSGEAKICDICVDVCNITLRRKEVIAAEWERLKDFAP